MAAEPKSIDDRMVLRKTNAHLGRHISVTPENSTNRHLSYGRIILKDRVKSVSFDTAARETSFIVLSGSVQIALSGETFELRKHDGVYIPRDTAVQVSTDASADVAEFSAEVAERYPLRIVRYDEVSKTPSLKFTAGTP